jgi:VCBS repeat-containing protein
MTTMVDSSGNGLDGTYSGSPTFGVDAGLTGDSDTAIGLAGSAFGEVAPDAAFDFPHFAVMARVKTLAGGTERSIIDRHRLSTGGGFQFRMESSGTLGLLLVSGNALVGSAVTSSVAVNDGSWHHVAGIVDGTNITVVVDGTNVTSVANTNSQPSVTDGIRVGANRSGSGDSPVAQCLGNIDEAAYFGTAVTTAQVAAIAAAQ